MSLGKTIRLYLMDGTAAGPMVAEIINWSGQVILLPRPQLADLAKRPELLRTGVYLLVGPDQGGGGRQRVYVGEGDVVWERLKEHDKTKEFWTVCVAITSKDENLTKAHGRYLEHRLCGMVAAAGRATADNGTSPSVKPLPEPDRADMEYFLEQVRLILPVLGFDFLRPPATQDSEAGKSEPRSPKLILDEVGIRAEAYEIDGLFVVLAGSTARAEATPSWDTYRDVRARLEQEQKLVLSETGKLRFVQDVEFTSPSAAASVIVGSNRNGRLAWCLEDGRTSYADWKEHLLKAAEGDAATGTAGVIS